jgi:hypothetical protein
MLFRKERIMRSYKVSRFYTNAPIVNFLIHLGFIKRLGFHLFFFFFGFGFIKFSGLLLGERAKWLNWIFRTKEYSK